MLSCPRSFEVVLRSASAPLEERTGASHVAEAGVRVEMMKIESDPNFKKARFYRVFFENRFEPRNQQSP